MLIGLQKDMQFGLIEPFELFIKTVRALGMRRACMPDHIVWQYSPGPGLAIRVMGITEEEGFRKGDDAST